MHSSAQNKEVGWMIGVLNPDFALVRLYWGQRRSQRSIVGRIAICRHRSVDLSLDLEICSPACYQLFYIQLLAQGLEKKGRVLDFLLP
jgi:hypothetical protein